MLIISQIKDMQVTNTILCKNIQSIFPQQAIIFLLSENVTRNRRISTMKQVQDIQELIKQIFLTNYNFQQLIN